jgi:hypothetical protein
MLTRLVKGLLNPRLNAATIKLNAKTNLIPHLKNKIFAGSAQSILPDPYRRHLPRRCFWHSQRWPPARCSRAAPPPFCPQPLRPKRHCRRYWSARSAGWWRSPTPTDGVDPLVIKSTWISAPAAKALSSRYLRKASCNTNAPFVRRSLSNAQCFTPTA